MGEKIQEGIKVYQWILRRKREKGENLESRFHLSCKNFEILYVYILISWFFPTFGLFSPDWYVFCSSRPFGLYNVSTVNHSSLNLNIYIDPMHISKVCNLTPNFPNIEFNNETYDFLTNAPYLQLIICNLINL